MENIQNLNKLMVDFYRAWEFENTEEQFISLNAELETTVELKRNIEIFEAKTKEIEDYINNKDNFELIIENWDAIDLKLLDSLISTFEINIEEFVKNIESSDVRKEIKEFITVR